MGKWRYGSLHLNLGIGCEMSGRPASRPSRFISWKAVPCTHARARAHTHTHTHTTHAHIRKQGRQQSPSGRFGKDRHLLLPRIEPRCLYCRLTARSLITIPTELSPLVAERDPVHTEDDNIMETLDNIGIKPFVLAALKEHQL